MLLSGWQRRTELLEFLTTLTKVRSILNIASGSSSVTNLLRSCLPLTGSSPIQTKVKCFEIFLAYQGLDWVFFSEETNTKYCFSSMLLLAVTCKNTWFELWSLNLINKIHMPFSLLNFLVLLLISMNVTGSFF